MKCYDPAAVDKLMPPVPVYGNFNCPPFARRGPTSGVCAVDWERRGGGETIYQWALRSLAEHNPNDPDGIKVADGYIADLPRRVDALGRTLDGRGNVIYTPDLWEMSERNNNRCQAEDYGTDRYSPWCHGPNGEQPRALVEPQYGPWDRTGWQPVVCPKATPTPPPPQAPQGPGPDSPPGSGPLVPPQPRDFRLNFVNGCDRLTHYRDGCGTCDSTQRFVGTLASGERHGDACDAIVARGPKTQELCQHERWDSTTGIDFRVNGETMPPNTDNPFNRRICAAPGTELTVETCLPPGAVTVDGVPIPGGPGCWAKTFTVQEGK